MQIKILYIKSIMRKITEKLVWGGECYFFLCNWLVTVHCCCATSYQLAALPLLLLQVSACHQAGGEQLGLNADKVTKLSWYESFQSENERRFPDTTEELPKLSVRSKSVCSWSAAKFYCRYYSNPRKKSHILSKQKICSQCAFQTSFTVTTDHCQSCFQRNGVGSIVSTPKNENSNCFLHFSCNTLRLSAVIIEVIGSRVPFTLLPQTLSAHLCQSMAGNDGNSQVFTTQKWMPRSEQSTSTGLHPLFLGKGRET